MTIRRHPSPVELSRAALEGPSLTVEEHLLGCESCTATMAEWRNMDELLRDRPSPRIPAERRASVLAAVLEEAFPATAPQRSRRPLWVWGSFAGAAATAAAIALVVGGSRTVPPAAAPLAQGPVYRGAIQAHADARFGRESGAPDEIVRLYEGTISVDVEKLQTGERFRVIVGDGEVEVRGTSFDVVAAGDRLALVRVDHGVVEVKPADRPMARLTEGERWEATLSAPVEATPPAPEVLAPPRPRRAAVASPAKAPVEEIAAPEPIPEAAPPPRHPMAELFDKGWKQLREGHPRDAANTFGEALAMDPTDALAEDASFWRGVALVRARASQEAMGALSAFLDAYPTSARAGETSALLGWILLERGDVDGAERRFRAAEADPVASVRASARKGLDAVETTRQNRSDPR